MTIILNKIFNKLYIKHFIEFLYVIMYRILKGFHKYRNQQKSNLFQLILYHLKIHYLFFYMLKQELYILILYNLYIFAHNF